MRGTWKALGSDDERERFKAEYWRRRDSNQQTPVNEFQALIQTRTEAADRQFAVAHTAGALSTAHRLSIVH